MEHLFDEFSKSFAESVPRRESLRRLGAVFAGAVLAPFGASTTWARGAGNPCKAFCGKCPRKQQSQCLAACQECGGDTSRVCGRCGDYTCCASGLACCGGYCTNLDTNYYNCGGCGYTCNQAGPNEDGVCVDGDCHYLCVTGTLRCNGTCIPVSSDPNNCGACGNVCPGDRPYCNAGVCGSIQCFGGQALCSGVCRELQNDLDNCGACGVVCGPGESCVGGVCQPAEPPTLAL